MRSIRLRVAIAILVASLGGSLRTAVADGPSSVLAELTLRAPADCATPEALLAHVASRSKRIRFTGRSPGIHSVEASLLPAASGGAIGEVLITQPDGRTLSRRLTAPSCLDAVDAIALVVVLALDPESDAARAPASASPQPIPPAAPLAAESVPRVPVAAVPAPAPGEWRRWFAGGARAELVVGPTSPLAGAAVYVSAGFDRNSVWSPAAALSIGRAWSGSHAEQGGIATFRFDAASLDACGLRLRLGPAEARVCATGLLGRIVANGSETYAPASPLRPFAAAGGAVLLRLSLGRFFEVSGRIALAASLIRDSFYFTPVVFHRADAFMLATSFGLGVHFP